VKPNVQGSLGGENYPPDYRTFDRRGSRGKGTARVYTRKLFNFALDSAKPTCHPRSVTSIMFNRPRESMAQSAGKRISSKTRRANPWLKALMTQVAWRLPTPKTLLVATVSQADDENVVSGALYWRWQIRF